MKTLKDITQSIQIEVETHYNEDLSIPEENHYIFSYTITIYNNSSTPTRLTHRHWTITDGNGKVEKIDGPGVVGKQPYIEAGSNYQYSSGAVLETPFGIMQGCYDMVTDQGYPFKAKISPFTLLKSKLTLH
ncbi:Co2+/Mg2+ efflux protein ApaG [Piscirickettsia litoralis]|uniref:Protein ApaG n=1 Tax=Piscirickettsia litoralis TaxID=1891921 RepID=A0ABX3A4G1_9GAMM|nr:Co2+/Mg2+ efflux protein ApaG [Piscirickettsia litoralis]ODN42546.1 Co2+/Mg2+ efflux protein ApaG [Piscirickettsia litoralis]